MLPLSLLDDITWRAVPDDACRLAKAAAGPYAVVQDLVPHLPTLDGSIWYCPYTEKVAFSYPIGTDSSKVASWHIALKQVPGITTVEHGFFYPEPDEPHVRIKRALENKDVFGPVASAMQLKPNALNKLWGGPNPLASTLAGGLLGAGIGYGGGWLAEQFLPEQYFEKGRLRKMTGLAGAAAGAAPGIWWGMDNMRGHPDPDQQGWRSWLSSYPLDKQSSSRFTQIKEGLDKQLSDEVKELDERWQKYAFETGADFSPSIPVDQFNRVIWNDLRSAGGSTDAPLAAATTGIVQAAALANGGVNFISPIDIARVGLGMGSGYVSGLVVGKTLGALAGLRPQAQEALQQGGAWAGILANVVPLVFR